VGKNKMKEKHTKPSFEGIKPIANPTFEEATRVAQERRNKWQSERPYVERADIKIDTQWPVTIFFIGDVHFGSVYCDYDLFQRDMKAINETPNAFVVWMSNLIDNAIPSMFGDSTMQNVMTPHDQAKAMNHLIQTMDKNGKCLGAVRSPCHEGWLWKKGGVDINEIIFANTHMPLLDNGGTLQIKLSQAEYNVALFHQFGPFNSNFNKSHAAQQMQRLVLQGKADIVALAHSHYGEVMQTFYGVGANRKDVVYVRSGSYKGNVSGILNYTPDMWIKDQRGTDGEPGGEAVMLRSDKREMLPFLNPLQALEAQKAFYYMSQIQAAGALHNLDRFLQAQRRRK
jgi:hypothetical protein